MPGNTGKLCNPALAVGALVTLYGALAGGCVSFQQKPITVDDPQHFVTVESFRIHVKEEGKGAAVLLVHGFGATARSWELVIPKLAKKFRVLAVDLPGHGRSDKMAGDYSPQGVARKLFGVLDLRGIKRVHVVGHSWGTSVTLAMAQMHPDRVKSITLIGAFAYERQLPPFLVWARAPGLGEFLFSMLWQERMDDRIGYAFYEPGIWAHPDVVEKTTALMDMPGAKAAGLAAVRGMRLSKMEPYYRTMKTPALLIAGREDRVTRLAAAERLNAELPNSHLVVLPRCGHVPILEQPGNVVGAVIPHVLAHETPAEDDAVPPEEMRQSSQLFETVEENSKSSDGTPSGSAAAPAHSGEVTP